INSAQDAPASIFMSITLRKALKLRVTLTLCAAWGSRQGAHARGMNSERSVGAGRPQTRAHPRQGMSGDAPDGAQGPDTNTKRPAGRRASAAHSSEFLLRLRRLLRAAAGLVMLLPVVLLRALGRSTGWLVRRRRVVGGAHRARKQDQTQDGDDLLEHREGLH